DSPAPSSCVATAPSSCVATSLCPWLMPTMWAMLTEPGGNIAQVVRGGDARPTEYGEVFTQQWIVELILDLCGYVPDIDLTAKRVLEPAVGSGAFLKAVLARLLDSRTKHAPDSTWD